MASSPQDFVGTFKDTTYGGQIYVCVTEDPSTGTFYAQAAFSGIGYMRGTIDSSTLVWSGKFLSSGNEVKQGTFSLSLVGTTSLSLSGSFMESPGITYSFTGSKLDSSTPTDINCFKSDLSLLTSNSFYDFTGIWVDPIKGVTTAVYVNQTLGQFTSSYNYDGNGVHYAGTEIHDLPLTLNGQVSSGDWYEGQNAFGVEIYVAKNQTTAYLVYWEVKRMADFNYTSHPYYNLAYIYRSPDKVSTYAIASANLCLSLPTWSTINQCQQGFSMISSDSSSSTNNNNDVSLSTGGIVGIVIGAVVLALLSAAIGFHLGKRSSTTNNNNNNNNNKSSSEPVVNQMLVAP